MDVLRATAGDVLRALPWALVTGRDSEFGPQLNWWRGPRWVGWLLVLAALIWWGPGMFIPLFIVELVPMLMLGRWPLTAVRVSLALMIVTMVVVTLAEVTRPWASELSPLPLVAVVAGAIARSPANRTAGIAIISVGTVGTGLLLGERIVNSGGLLVAMLAAVLVGYALNYGRLARQETEAEREKRIVLQERSRIAMELHDVIGHHLSIIAVRTDSAPYRIAGLSQPAREELAAVGAAAREALDEARRLLGLLRADSEAPHVPQPTIDDVPDLVRASQETGVEVALTVVGTPGAVPASVGLSAYRILQESLSNARRHSPGAPVTVVLRHRADAVELTVDNEPGAALLPAGKGIGLAGIAERVGMVGGTYAAGPRADGGFRVAVTLPVSR